MSQEPHHFLAAIAGSSVSISIQGVPTAQGAIVNYITLPGNLPNTFGNHIYVWQTTANVVPWTNKPDGDTAVTNNSSTSTVLSTFAYEDKGYVIGYGVAPTPNAVCATIYIPAGAQQNPQSWQYANVGLSVVYVGTNLIQMQYTGLQSYTPATNKNWIGIWQGAYVPWAGDPIKMVSITQDAPSSGYITMDGIKLLIGIQYVVGYFMADPKTGRTALAASATFTVGQSQE